MRPLTALLALGLLAGSAGCAGEDDVDTSSRPSASPTPSAADLACRAQWSALGVQVRSRARLGVNVRTAFAARWNAVEAGIDYYVQLADDEKCSDLLDARRTTVAKVSAVQAMGLPYDAAQRLRSARALRTIYNATTGAREPAAVRAAYVALAKRTPQASSDLEPAYDELARADPTDTAAVKLAASDLALLADTSDAYRACDEARSTIRAYNASLITS